MRKTYNIKLNLDKPMDKLLYDRIEKWKELHTTQWKKGKFSELVKPLLIEHLESEENENGPS